MSGRKQNYRIKLSPVWFGLLCVGIVFFRGFRNTPHGTEEDKKFPSQKFTSGKCLDSTHKTTNLVADCSSQCYRESRKTDKSELVGDFAFTSMWKDLHKKNQSWPSRAKIIAKYIRPQDSPVVLDLAAGAMAMRGLIPETSKYIPVDIHRRDQDTIICDFNMGEYPLTIEPRPTVVIAQGVYEYLLDKRMFIRMLRHHGVRVVMSYNFHEVNQNDIWVAPLTRKLFVDLVQKIGFNITATEKCDSRQEVFVLDPI